jgi:CRISPR-associated protein Cmr6
VCALPATCTAQIAALRSRQQALIQHHDRNGYRISTTSTAPFATGLGNEHPIENGFAFLTPYGLPYLAGSGVKGILRRSMQELIDDGEEGFTFHAIDALFGPENISQPEDAKRGALDFWDVFPNPAGGKLAVEIMTPHYSKYYQREESPHDSGAPVPVSFLAVPAKSQFDFHVVCQPSRLPESLKDQWRVLLDRAFQHAFEWVGFGAKTSVGYGAMQPALKSATSSGSSSSNAAINSQGVASNINTSTEIWPAARIKFNRANGTLTVENNGAQAHAITPQGEALLNALPPAIQSKIRRSEFVKVKAVVTGNTLIKLEL